ncbi:hypothetical protein [Streptomyces pseudogriseolus]|uniref:hypothetical protein n=1 Tax=Streptomyces pseudogriseolus TaxID=36817 RepID=UPI001CE25FA2|nr:hypothetical protein [Streptomyces pseudogriseolus]
MSSTLTDIQPDQFGSTNAFETAGTGRHRGRRAAGDMWATGSETVGHGRHRRTTSVMSARPAAIPGIPSVGEPAGQLLRN